MKKVSQKQSKSLNSFLKKEIKQPETIFGGSKGPIDRDKIKRPSRRR